MRVAKKKRLEKMKTIGGRAQKRYTAVKCNNTETRFTCYGFSKRYLQFKWYKILSTTSTRKNVLAPASMISASKQ